MNSASPVRWTQLPHDKIWRTAQECLKLGSQSRAHEDGERHVLKRRLHLCQSEVHFRYLEIECSRLIQMLRALRDTYRNFLEELGRRPLSEVYWVVFRFGIIDASVKVLRQACFEYVLGSRVAGFPWHSLFSPVLDDFIRIPTEDHRETDPGAEVLHEEKDRFPPLTAECLTSTLNQAISEMTLSEVTFEGGQFGREAQLMWARRFPWAGFTIPKQIELRKQLWDMCLPWVEGLTRLWDSVQEELVQQANHLPTDSRRAEAAFVQLSPFEKMAHKHIGAMRSVSPGKNPVIFSADGWLKLARELDETKVSLDAELHGKGANLRTALGRQGKSVTTWEQALQPRLRASLADGKVYELAPIVKKAIHNAARTAARQLALVWRTGRKSSP